MTLSIVELLRSGIVLLDGGLGAMLIARGLPDGVRPEVWNVERPEIVGAVHEDFLRAGSDVVQTNSFGGNAVVLARHGLERRLVELNLAAARVAREATEVVGRGIVAGNIGPTGLFQRTRGRGSLADVKDAFGDQAAALADGGVDYFSLETFSDPGEARLAIAAVQAVSDLPFTACITFDRAERGFQTLTGEPLPEVAAALAEEGACAVGANCSIGSAAMLEAAPILLRAVNVPTIFKPNAGLPEVVDDVPHYRQSPEEFAGHLARLAGLGARVLGGCCGCDERFIAALRRELG